MHTTQTLFTQTQIQRKNVLHPKLSHILLDCEANVKLILRHFSHTKKNVLLCCSTAQMSSSLAQGSIKCSIEDAQRGKIMIKTQTPALIGQQEAFSLFELTVIMRHRQKTKAQGGFPRLSFLNPLLEYTAVLIV